MEIFMYEVSLRRKDKMLSREMIDYAIRGVQHSIRDSTLPYFEDSQYF